MVFKRIKKGLKKVGKRVVRAAGSVGRSVLAGQGLAGAVRGQLKVNLPSLLGKVPMTMANRRLLVSAGWVSE